MLPRTLDNYFFSHRILPFKPVNYTRKTKENPYIEVNAAP